MVDDGLELLDVELDAAVARKADDPSALRCERGSDARRQIVTHRGGSGIDASTTSAFSRGSVHHKESDDRPVEKPSLILPSRSRSDRHGRWDSSSAGARTRNAFERDTQGATHGTRGLHQRVEIHRKINFVCG